MKKRAQMKIIGLILLAAGIFMLINVLTDFSYLRKLFYSLGVEHPGTTAYKIVGLLEPIKLPIMLISVGGIIVGVYMVKEGA